MKQVYVKGIGIVLLLLMYVSVLAQDCGCDHVIETSKSFVRASDMPDVKPGDVICIQAGIRGRLKLVGFQGTKEQPLIFKNCGGQVIFDNPDVDGTFVIDNSRYFRVTGTGSTSHKYGFYIRTAGKGSAMYVTESDFELDHIEIGAAGFAGMMAKIDPKCDNTQYHLGNFVMENISIHDNYVHDTRAEGFYIGSSFYAGKTESCGKLYPHEIHGLRMYNNRVENTGADGIQVGCATKDVEVYDNVIRKYGQNPFEPSQNMGIILNPGTTGKWYNNQVIDGTGMGIQVLGIGNVYLFNNLIVRPGRDGVFIDERTELIPNSGFHVLNNTIVNPGRDGIRLYTKTSVGNTVINNIIAQPESLSENYYSKDQFLFILDPVIQYTQHHNLFLKTVAEAGFADPAKDDYSLLPSSPAVDTGIGLGSLVTADLNKTARPQGAAFDIGALELKVTTESINDPSNLQAQPGTESLSIKLQWQDNSDNEQNFVLERSEIQTFGQVQSMTLAANTQSYTDKGLTAGKTYYYRIIAKGNSAKSGYSNTATLLLEAQTPPPPASVETPTSLTATYSSAGTVQLSWKDVATNETKYIVERSTSSTFTSPQQWTLAANASTYEDVSSLQRNTTYYYRVLAANDSQKSGYSNVASVQVPKQLIVKGKGKQQLKIYPNPTKSVLRFQNEDAQAGDYNYTYSITDLSGKTVKEGVAYLQPARD
ncbi:right-handed parallel beta-helix repeat-containing protein [Cesiribacter andamanensis]|uniref:Fibronectin type III domain protein n=1 Tax=Cesiribacter andamanensis AMV16 TaxID=1279009 RepID=M7NBL3_9BACT|nr:right-handed parallel beta-helix repeat-containing protein [Cesiribacter andamanensis]EMR04647.1 Fibronectin type III domain protein [Cesiribacter andamanensis AMV16]